MPAKNTTYKSGKRNLIVDKEFCDEVREKTGLDISDKEIRKIIITSNDEIRNSIADSDDAFKLPERLGYIAVTRYKSKKRPIDWTNTFKLKKKIPYINLHSFGYIYHIKWFKKSQSNFGLKAVYKLEPSRRLTRQVSRNALNGKIYHEWENSDFWSTDDMYKKVNNG